MSCSSGRGSHTGAEAAAGLDTVRPRPGRGAGSPWSSGSPQPDGSALLAGHSVAVKSPCAGAGVLGQKSGLRLLHCDTQAGRLASWSPSTVAPHGPGGRASPGPDRAAEQRPPLRGPPTRGGRVGAGGGLGPAGRKRRAGRPGTSVPPGAAPARSQGLPRGTPHRSVLSEAAGSVVCGCIRRPPLRRKRQGPAAGLGP